MSGTQTVPARTTAPPPAPRRGAFRGFGGGFQIFRIRGVPVRVDLSWMVMAAFVVVSLYGRYARLEALESMTERLSAAVAYAVLFLGSILAHEIGHTVASLNRGIPVAGITLFALGGVTESTREANSAKDEFVIVGIGPWISLVLAALFGLCFMAVENVAVPAAVFGYVAWTNLALAVFNLVPGYPLDGGRLLRSVVWAITGRPHQATRWAARVGQVFALGLIAAGVLPVLGINLISFGGLYEAFIGLFLLRGATAAHRRAGLRERLEARTAGQVMGSAPPTLPAELSVAEAVARVRTRPSLLWPVGDDPLLGGVTLAQLEEVASSAWDATTVAAVTVPAAQVTVGADESMDAAVARLFDGPSGMLLVVADGRVVGLLTPTLAAGAEG